MTTWNLPIFLPDSTKYSDYMQPCGKTVFIRFEELSKIYFNDADTYVAVLKFDGPSFRDGLMVTLLEYDSRYMEVVNVDFDNVNEARTKNLNYVDPNPSSEYYTI